MAKKRERRVKLSSDRSSNRVDSVEKKHNSRKHKLVSTFVLLFVVAPAISVFVYRKLYSPPDTVTDTNLPYVYQRGLVDAELNFRQVLTENMKVSENSSSRHFDNPVLAYITPWNSKGYDMAKKFTSKFTHLSPVWYELKSQGTKLVLEGRHNADTKWISELRLNGDALVLPRVVLEANPMDLLKKKKQRAKAIDLIITECREMDYDGIVLESWSRWAAYGVLHDPDMRILALQFLNQLGEAIHSSSSQRDSQKTLQLIYVIGPPHSDKLHEHDFGPEDLQKLSEAVDGFSLMTYDFSGPQNPGPNAPLQWINSVMQLLLGAKSSDGHKLAKKIFVGLNFYGNDFIVSGGLGGGPILGRDYLSLLEKHEPVLQWEKKSAEHFFIYSDDQNFKHVVFYPTLMSISLRLEEALSWGAGISIWEIGQGLDYFCDLL